MADKTLVCEDCGKEFIFTEGEQEFYKEKGFENEPKRCPDCRKARKHQRQNRTNKRRGNSSPFFYFYPMATIRKYLTAATPLDRFF